MNESDTKIKIGFLGIVQIVLIILKLFDLIDWNWIWVLSPSWIPIGLVVGVFLFVTILALLINLNDRR